MSDWEGHRNKAKPPVDERYRSLKTPAEKLFVAERMDHIFNILGGGRRRARSSATSPVRTPSLRSKRPGMIFEGGEYASKPPDRPAISLAATGNKASAGATQSLRLPARL
jgi:hypothetical protein